MTPSFTAGGSGIRTAEWGAIQPWVYKPSFSVFYSELPIVCPRYAVLRKTKNVSTGYFRANLGHKEIVRIDSRCFESSYTSLSLAIPRFLPLQRREARNVLALVA